MRLERIRRFQGHQARLAERRRLVSAFCAEARAFGQEHLEEGGDVLALVLSDEEIIEGFPTMNMADVRACFDGTWLWACPEPRQPSSSNWKAFFQTWETA